MADGHFPTLVSATRDANASGNPIYIQITGGTNTASVTANNELQAILGANSGVDIGDVDVTSVIPGTGATNLGKAIDTAAGSTDTGVAALVVRDDALSTLTPVEGDYVPLRVDANGALWVTLTAAGNSNIIQDDSAFTPGTSYVGAAGYLADETTPDSVDEGDIGAARMTLDRKQLIVLADATTDSQRLAIDSNGAASAILAANSGVDIGDVDVTSVIPGTGATNLGKAVDSAGGGTDTGVAALFLRDDALSALTPVEGDYVRGRVDSTGALWVKDTTLAANSETSPVYVQVVTSGVSGNEVHDYDTQASLASDTADNHDYAVAGTTFLLKSVIFASSGGMKVEIQTGPVASLATDAVGFLPKEGGFGQLFFDPPIEVPATSTGTVRVIRTNRQGADQDVYSTIIGNDVT